MTQRCALFLAVLMCAASLPAARAGEERRIAYFEAGQFWLFDYDYHAFRAALAKSGKYAAAFPPELHISPGWDAPEEELDRLAATLQRRDDVSLIVAAGTAATRALLRTNAGKIPILAVALSDPLASGIIPGADDSGADNFTCDVAADRWTQMFHVFHEVVGFKKLGMLYPAGPDGKTYANIADAEAVAGAAGFTVVEMEIPDESAESCAEGLRRLHEAGADAFFIGPLNCFDWSREDPAPLFSLLNRRYKMATFARDGEYLVQCGALMGFTTWDFDMAGRRYAEKAEKIFDGVRPRDLPMRVDIQPRIAVNLETALALEIDLPFAILIAADEIVTKTSRPAIPSPGPR